MDAELPLRFQPTIVICVGEAGKAARQELSTLLRDLDGPRRAGMALLCVEEDAGEGGAPLAWWDGADSLAHLDGASRGHTQSAATPSSSRADVAEPLERRHLSELLVRTLRGEMILVESNGSRASMLYAKRRGILDDEVIGKLQADGYDVPQAKVLVWIVARADSPVLLAVAQATRTALASENVSSTVLLALANTYPAAPEERRQQEERCCQQPWDELLVGDGTADEPPLATFAYLFESRDERGFYWSESSDVSYAIAEAILLLMTSGIVDAPAVADIYHASVPHLVKSPLERISGLGTSRLLFPRKEVEQYCSATLVALTLEQWTSRQSVCGSSTLSAQAEQDEVANTWVASVFGPHTGSETATSDAIIAALRNSDDRQRLPASVQMPLVSPSETLIWRHLNEDELDRLVAASRDFPAVLQEQATRATEGEARWRHVVGPLWEAYERVTLDQLDALCERLLVQDVDGVAKANLYLATLRHHLDNVGASLEDVRREHAERYLRLLDEMDLRGAGEPWAAQWLADANNEGEVPEPASLVQREAMVRSRLDARYRWLVSRPSPVPAVAALTALSTPPLVLLERSFLPSVLAHSGLAVLACTLVTACLLAVGAWQIVRRRPSLAQARADLIAATRERFRYSCRLHDDQRRKALLARVCEHVDVLRQQLERWDDFATATARTFRARADEVEQELFTKASGRRDVLLVNEHRLRPTGYALAQVAADVLRARDGDVGTSTSQWWQHPPQLRQYLAGQLPEGMTLLQGASGEMAQAFYAGCLAVVRTALTGEVSDVSEALKNMPPEEQTEILAILAERATALYKPQHAPRHQPVTFVAARHGQALPSDGQLQHSTLALIHDREWLAVLRFHHGGELPSFWRAAEVADRVDLSAHVLWEAVPGAGTRRHGWGEE